MIHLNKLLIGEPHSSERDATKALNFSKEAIVRSETFARHSQGKITPSMTQPLEYMNTIEVYVI